MTLEVWLTYLIAGIVLSVSPGAGAVNTMSNGMSYGFKYSLISILGLQLGLALQFVLVGIGLGAIVAQSALAFSIIKWAGVAYLIYLGVMKFKQQGAFDVNAYNEPKVPPLTLFAKAVLVNVTNPKSIVFLVVLLPQFINPHAPQALQFTILGLTSVGVDLVVMLGYALLATQLALFVRSEKHMRLQNRIFGGMFIGAGSLLAVASHK